MYDEYYDCVLCPEYQALSYRTTSRDGYRDAGAIPHLCQLSHLPSVYPFQRLCQNSTAAYLEAMRT